MDTKALHDMFVLGLPLSEKIVRPILVYIFLVVGLRLAGKRELAQLNPFDLVVLLTISNTVQNAIIGNDNSVTGGLVGAATLLIVNYVVIRFLYHHERIDRLVEGESETLVDQGTVRMDRLRRNLVTLAELDAEAHRQGYESLREIERCDLDPNGRLLFTPKQPTLDRMRHGEILSRIDRLTEAVAQLKP